MMPELLVDAAVLASEVARGDVEELLGAIMIVIRKRFERRKVRPLWDHYGYETLFNESRTPFFHWIFLGPVIRRS